LLNLSTRPSLCLQSRGTNDSKAAYKEGFMCARGLGLQCISNYIFAKKLGGPWPGLALTELYLSFLYNLTKPECRVILNNGSINKGFLFSCPQVVSCTHFSPAA
jgi:hypothetical protein